ncbi:MAG: hypothetical protein WBC91_24875 [Phototrophicaceae bacterium]
MKKSISVFILLFLLTSHAFAQDDPQYLQVNSGTDIIVNSGQSAYIVLQINNPSSETLLNVEVLCSINIFTGAIIVDEDNTQAYILETVEITDTSATFGVDVDVDFVAGQSGNVQLVVGVEDSETEITEAVVTCNLFADDSSLGTVNVNLASNGMHVANNDNNDSSSDSTSDGAIISINNGAEILVADGESIELVIQVGNAGQETLENVLVICSLDELDGELTVIEERTNPRDFISYVFDDNTVMFGEGEAISLPAGQNTNLALGILLESDSAGISCVITSDTTVADDSDPATALVSDRNSPRANTTTTDSDDAESSASLSINNGSEVTVGNGQSVELVLQFGNSSDSVLDAVSIVCSIATSDGALSFSDARTNVYGAGDFVIDGDTLTITIDSTIPQGQTMKATVGIQVNEAHTDAVVICDLLNDGDALANTSVAITSN